MERISKINICIIGVNLMLLFINFYFFSQNVIASNANLINANKLKSLTESSDVKQLVQSYNNLVDDNYNSQQMFMDTLPKRQNCIHSFDCDNMKNNFLDNDCRYFYYFDKEHYTNMLSGGRVCNFESGEFLLNYSREEKPNYWCDENGYCDEKNITNQDYTQLLLKV